MSAVLTAPAATESSQVVGKAFMNTSYGPLALVGTGDGDRVVTRGSLVVVDDGVIRIDDIVNVAGTWQIASSRAA